MPDPLRFEHYEVLMRPDGSLWELGRGAMGVTYKAWDRDLRCHAALKVVHPLVIGDADAQTRFLREARAAARLQHPNIAKVFRLGKAEDGSHYFAMEYCEGPTLEEAVTSDGPFPASRALGVALQICKALIESEAGHVVHRDIKPANLILTESKSEGLVVKVIDFGVAKCLAQAGQSMASQTNGRGFVGTAHFASPEQLEEKEVDSRSDIYSLGGCLWYMLTGRTLFEGSLAQVMAQTLHTEPDWEKLTGQPEAVVTLLGRMLKKKREDRPANAAALKNEIEQCLSRLHTPAQSTGQPSPTNARTGPAMETLRPRPPQRKPAERRVLDRFVCREERTHHGIGKVFDGEDLHHPHSTVTICLIDLASEDERAWWPALEKQIQWLEGNPQPGFPTILASGLSQGQQTVVAEVAGKENALQYDGKHPAPSPLEAAQLLKPVASAFDAWEAAGFAVPAAGLDALFTEASRAPESQSSRTAPMMKFDILPALLNAEAGTSSSVLATAHYFQELTRSGATLADSPPAVRAAAALALQQASAGDFTSAQAWLAHLEDTLSGNFAEVSPSHPQTAPRPKRLVPIAILLLVILGGCYAWLQLSRPATNPKISESPPEMPQMPVQEPAEGAAAPKPTPLLTEPTAPSVGNLTPLTANGTAADEADAKTPPAPTPAEMKPEPPSSPNDGEMAASGKKSTPLPNEATTTPGNAESPEQGMVGWELVSHDGRDYVTALSVNRFYRFSTLSVTGNTVSFSSKVLAMQGSLNSTTFHINTIKFILSHPLIQLEGKPCISRLDLCKLLDPVLRPSYIRKGVTFDTVVLDPQHGGSDTGIKGLYGYEKEYTLKLALALKTKLESQGIKVVMTRLTDVLVPTTNRVAYANNVPNSIFISLGFGEDGASKPEIATYALAPQDDPTDPSYKGNRQDSSNISLATALHASVISHFKLTDGGVQRSQNIMLKGLEVPAAMMNCGSLTDPTEAKFVASDKYHDAFAKTLAQAVMNYRTALQPKPKSR